MVINLETWIILTSMKSLRFPLYIGVNDEEDAINALSLGF